MTLKTWLEELSLDADRSDLCPNLVYIPLNQLRRLHREGCAPCAEAIIAHRWKPKRRPSMPPPGVLVTSRCDTLRGIDAGAAISRK